VTPDAWTAIGTLALAAVTTLSTGWAVWQPRLDERRKRKTAAELDLNKCLTASMQMRNWVEQLPNDRWSVHLLSDAGYPIRSILGGMLGRDVAIGGLAVTSDLHGNPALLLERDDDQRLDQWYVVFFDPEGNRRILVSYLPDAAANGQDVFPAPYERDVTSLAMEKGIELRKQWEHDNISQPSTGRLDGGGGPLSRARTVLPGFRSQR
jgi:hypothetical protein